MENEIIQKKKGKKKIILIVSFAIAAILISIIVAIMFAYLPLDNKTPYRKLNSFLVGDNKIFSKTQLNDDGYILFNATANKNEVIMQFIHMVEVDGENDVLMGLNFYVEPKNTKLIFLTFGLKLVRNMSFCVEKKMMFLNVNVVLIPICILMVRV